MVRPALAAGVCLLALSGCALAGIPLGLTWPGAAVLTLLALAGCGLPPAPSGKSAPPYTGPNSELPPGGNTGPGALHGLDANTLAVGDGTLGFVVDGYFNSYTLLGHSVSLGNLNGDGFADIAMGAPGTFGSGGYAYVVNGHAAPFAPQSYAYISADLYLSGTGIYGENVGYAVAFVGDVTGDGFEDLAIGAPNAGYGDGFVLVMFGGPGISGAMSVDSNLYYGGYGNFLTSPSYADNFGGSIATLGNVMGDSRQDFVVGAPYFSEYYSDGGQVMIVDGAATTGYGGPVVSVTPSIAPANRVRMSYSYYYAGTAVAGGGDVDGDGRNDVVVGAPGNATYPGQAFLYSTQNTTGSVSFFPASVRLQFLGAADEHTGAAVAIGDFNGDGFPDMVVGAPIVNTGIGNNGRVTIIFGGPSLAGVTYLTPGSMNGANGFNIFGSTPYEFAGSAVAFVGDINGDGYQDLVIGGQYGYDSSGYYYLGVRAHVIFGGPGPWPANLDLATATSSQAVTIVAKDTYAGSPGGHRVSVAGGRDVDGDGLPDIVIGAPTFYGSGGRVYVIFNKALRQ